jgi:hypothetical protein
MKTYSHLLIGASLREALGSPGMMGCAFLYGAVVPDLPLWIMFACIVVQWVVFRGLPFGEAVEIFSANYFDNAWWIAGHNLLHSPASLVIASVLVRLGMSMQPGRRRVLEQAGWFLLGCMLHSAADVLTHYDDGPLLFWPLQWETRFHSPVSHWDPAHHGLAMTITELVMDFILLSWLASRHSCHRLLYQLRLMPA